MASTPPPWSALWKPRSGRLSGLDGLRGVLAALIVITHLHEQWTPGGQIAVDLFFVVSGYVITGVLLKQWERGGRFDLRAFYRARWTRLAPALFASVAVFSVVLAILGGVWIYDLKRAPIAVTYLMDFYRASRPYGDDAGGVFAHTWSLAVEEQFYLVYPLALALILRKVRRERQVAVLLGLSALAIVWRGILTTFGTHTVNYIYNMPDTRADQLLIGSALALGVWQVGHPPEWLTTASRWAVWPVLAGFVVLVFRFRPQTTVHTWESPLVMTYSSLAGVFVVACLSYDAGHPLTRLLSKAPFLALGTISYGLYVWHYPVVVLLQTAHGLDLAEQSVLILAISLTLAVLSWRYLETRFHRPQARPLPDAEMPVEPGRAVAPEPS